MDLSLRLSVFLERVFASFGETRAIVIGEKLEFGRLVFAVRP